MENDIQHLDQMFNESLERLGNQTSTSSSLYNGNPLAAENLLLQKSWEYFRERIKKTEEQWKDILKAKGDQISVLSKEVEDLWRRIKELEEENLLLKSFEEQVKSVRKDDFSQFQKNTEKLRARWEEERATLQRTIEEQRWEIEKFKQELKKKGEEYSQKELRLKDAVQAVERESSTQIEQHCKAQADSASLMEKNQEDFRLRESQIDLLRAEVERRDALLKDNRLQMAENDRRNEQVLKDLFTSQALLKERDAEINNLKTRIEILVKEKDEMRTTWQREQAEWRELWERGRQAFEAERQQKK